MKTLHVIPIDNFEARIIELNSHNVWTSILFLSNIRHSAIFTDRDLLKTVLKKKIEIKYIHIVTRLIKQLKVMKNGNEEKSRVFYQPLVTAYQD